MESHLLDIIAAEGPIPVRRFMAEALMHPEHGYYRRGDPLGRDGDFTTAPEVSQIFGELIGLWLAERWENLGRPDPVRLIELGPGRGTLMADALRAMEVVPGLVGAVDLHFVESNETLRTLQAQKLRATWHDRFDMVPEGPLLLVANEFFDALPICQFVKTESGWQERMIAVEDRRLTFTLGPAGDEAELIPHALRGSAPGALVEICPDAIGIMGQLAKRIACVGGAALVFDYGYTVSATGDTLQAVRRHQPVPVLEAPGTSDLTAHVNFEQLAAAARAAGAETAGPVPQGAFLDALGIHLRAAMLCRRANQRQRREIETGVRRLTAPDLMGELFKVLGVVSSPESPPGLGEIGRE